MNANYLNLKQNQFWMDCGAKCKRLNHRVYVRLKKKKDHNIWLGNS